MFKLSKVQARFFSLITISLLCQWHFAIAVILVLLITSVDVVSYRNGIFRPWIIQETCAIYCCLVGIAIKTRIKRLSYGISLVAVLSLHCALVFLPITISCSLFDLYFYHANCWSECDFVDLWSNGVSCEFFCGNEFESMMINNTTYLHWGSDPKSSKIIIGISVLEILISVAIFVSFCGLKYQNMGKMDIKPIIPTKMLPKSKTADRGTFYDSDASDITVFESKGPNNPRPRIISIRSSPLHDTNSPIC